MNTDFCLFNLAIAIRAMRPNNDYNQHQETAPQPEGILKAIDYSLLANFPDDVANGAKNVVATFGTTANMGWVWAVLRSES
jgi:hypothetical protein